MDFKAMGATASKSDSQNRAIVTGRVLQDDTDFVCYQCASLDQPLSYAFQRVMDNLDYARRIAGAEFVNMHLTMGMKGGRAEMATVQEYQNNRKKKKNPELAYRVGELRSMLANHKSIRFRPIANTTQEADDSLRQMQHDHILKFGLESSVIRSGDKDLWFADGLHIDDLGRFYEVHGYGETSYREVGNVKPKLIGRGTSWFWHQLIMGDEADHIKGLPMLSGRLMNRYIPTKSYNATRKAAACGEAKAVAMFTGVTTDTEAAKRAMEAYQEHYGLIIGAEMLVEQAFLLWIRKTNKLTEVITFLRECGLNVSFSKAQIGRLQAYGAKVKKQQAMK